MVLREVEGGVFENGDEVGEAFHHFLIGAELGGIVQVWHIAELVGIGQRGEDLLVDLVADVACAFERDHVSKTGPCGMII